MCHGLPAWIPAAAVFEMGGRLFYVTLAISITFSYTERYMFRFVYDKHASGTNQEGSSFGAMGRSAGQRDGDLMWQDAVPRAGA